ncbi:D-inositol-3-phosphate glycosyltransferase [Paraconexibacter sp. AEG42_29]|uniref:D-inositol-3-phosphate glycosyltransferase n=1 Tax=Paraconexibacter sp. AEG42_29 TaxID=2997339 RepID=A0AAU7AW68_9ACTN
MTHASAPPSRPRRALEIWCDAFPSVSETFVLAEAQHLAALGHPVRIGAGSRGDGPDTSGLPVSVQWEETTSARLAALARIVVRHPVRCAADLLARRRWRREESVPPLRTLAPAIVRLQRSGALVHAHFATAPALRALRAGRILGRPWTLTAHAYDIYRTPANLPEKLRAAAFVTSGCDYTVRDLQALAGPDHAPGVHRIVMGVDPERFRRTQPLPGGRRIVAVGRLVPKKGFALLLDALAHPALDAAELVLVGDGPLDADLRARAARLGIAGRVSFAGAVGVDGVRDALERADVLAMPCVIAPDGDRDSMPVVVKEAMAMEVPVVVSDAVGLPELVRPRFGGVVPAGDASALAAALVAVLAADADGRAAMGRAAREHVSAFANVATETGRLSDLLGSVRPLSDAVAATPTSSPPTD